MILLEELFNDLQYGELSQFSVTGDIDDPMTGISPADYPAVISHLNKALTAIHTRLPLRDRELTLQLVEELSFYVLSSEYAVSNDESTEPIKYIIDTDDRPFIDDVLGITAVYDESGCKLPLNDDNDCNSLFLNNYRTLQVPNPSDEETLFLTYRSNHPKIEPDADPSTTEIDIPDYCIEPVLFYIASRMYARSNDQGAAARSIEMVQKYELFCTEIERRNVLNNYNNNTNVKLERRGFV